jgi:RNA polymerase sigma factor (sigma-70 family)
MMQSETVIVAAIRTGNIRRAVELLLDTYQEELFGYCTRLVGLRDSMITYQRVLATALEQIASFDPKISIRAWLYGIARSIVLQHHRQHTDDHPEARGASYVPTSGPPETLGLRLKDDFLDGALARLPPPVQEILQLAVWHSLTLAEVGYVVGQTPAGVRRLACEGLAQLSLEVQRGSAAPS